MEPPPGSSTMLLCMICIIVLFLCLVWLVFVERTGFCQTGRTSNWGNKQLYIYCRGGCSADTTLQGGGGGEALKFDGLITKIVECWLFFLENYQWLKRMWTTYTFSTHCTRLLIKNETLLTRWTLMRFNLVLGV